MGSGSVLQHIPSETTVLDPSSIIVPPPVAEVIVIPVTEEVEISGSLFPEHELTRTIRVFAINKTEKN